MPTPVENLRRRIHYLICAHSSRIARLRQQLRDKGVPAKRLALAEWNLTRHYQEQLQRLQAGCPHDFTSWADVATTGAVWPGVAAFQQRQCRVCLAREQRPRPPAGAANDDH